jgi:hypothetical protein
LSTRLKNREAIPRVVKFALNLSQTFGKTMTLNPNQTLPHITGLLFDLRELRVDALEQFDEDRRFQVGSRHYHPRLLLDW